MHKTRISTAVALLASVALALSGCGEDGTQTESADSTGFEFEASQEEVDAIVADLDPVTLTYQPTAGSPNSVQAQSATNFKEVVEERSDGRITIDIVWGQGIAGFPELFDALSDGRVDLAATLPGYEPDEFPIFSALGTSLSGLPVSPVVGEAVLAGVAAELGGRARGYALNLRQKGSYL